jgi:hypothetical protein
LRQLQRNAQLVKAACRSGRCHRDGAAALRRKMKLRPVIAAALLVFGLAFLAFGLNHRDPDKAVTTPPTCDGKPMSPGDRCIRIGPGSGSGVRDYDEAVRYEEDAARSDYNVHTWAARTMAALLLPVGGYQLYRTFRPRPRRRSMGRESFAARHGWTYAETDPDVLQGWQIGPCARGTDSSATRVVRGTYKGWPCAIFDYHWQPGEPGAGSAPPNGGMLATTMFVINIRGVSSPVELQLKPNWWRDRAPQQAGDDVFMRLLNERYTVTIDDAATAERVLTWRVVSDILNHLHDFSVYLDAPGLAAHKGLLSDAETRSALPPSLKQLAKVAKTLTDASGPASVDSCP